jgi:hypothetical protein
VSRRNIVLTVERYRKTRFWAVYDAGELVCVTVYKKGANAVKARLEAARLPMTASEMLQGDSVTN